MVSHVELVGQVQVNAVAENMSLGRAIRLLAQDKYCLKTTIYMAAFIQWRQNWEKPCQILCFSLY